MAPSPSIPLSPAELSYLHASLAATPPIRPDGRAPTQFRPLVAETAILPAAYGSARVCFADGTEAVVGVKGEVERTGAHGTGLGSAAGGERGDVDMEDEDDGGVRLRAEGEEGEKGMKGRGREGWVEVSIEIPGMRDDDALPVFLAAMLTEALTADGAFQDRLWINARFHWRLYVDILLLSQPLSYPLPLLSLTTHLALLSTRLPALISEKDEDPLFNDDWQAASLLYPSPTTRKPPITLLVMSVGANILFDPSTDELAVADAVLAISAAQTTDGALQAICLRTVDPPSRLTAAGVPTALNATAGGGVLSAAEAAALRERDQGRSVWRPPRGGVRREVVGRMVKMVVERGGVGEEVLAGLAGVET